MTFFGKDIGPADNIFYERPKLKQFFINRNLFVNGNRAWINNYYTLFCMSLLIPKIRKLGETNNP